MGRLVAIALLLVAPLAAGCVTHTYVVSGTTPTDHPDDVEWRSHLLAGLISLDGDIDLREACPQGVALIEDQVEFLNGLLWLVTGFIYTPSTVDIYCQAPQPAAAEPPGEVPVVELPPPGSAEPEPAEAPAASEAAEPPADDPASPLAE